MASPISSRGSQRASRDFLVRALGKRPGARDVYRHMMSFAGRGVDSFRAWNGFVVAGAVTTDTPAALAQVANDERLGNALRASRSLIAKPCGRNRPGTELSPAARLRQRYQCASSPTFAP